MKSVNTKPNVPPVPKKSHKWKLYGSLIAVLGVQSGTSLVYSIAQQNPKIQMQSFASSGIESATETQEVLTTKTQVQANGRTINVTLRSVKGSGTTQITEALGADCNCSLATGLTINKELVSKDDNSNLGMILADATNVLTATLSVKDKVTPAVLKKSAEDKAKELGAACEGKDDDTEDSDEDMYIASPEESEYSECHSDQLIKLSEDGDSSPETKALIEAYFKLYVKNLVKRGQNKILEIEASQAFDSYNDSTSLAGKLIRDLDLKNSKSVVSEINRILKAGYAERQKETQRKLVQTLQRQALMKNQLENAKTSLETAKLALQNAKSPTELQMANRNLQRANQNMMRADTAFNREQQRVDLYSTLLSKGPSTLYDRQVSMYENAIAFPGRSATDRAALELMYQNDFSNALDPWVLEMSQTRTAEEWGTYVIPEIDGADYIPGIGTVSPAVVYQSIRKRGGDLTFQRPSNDRVRTEGQIHNFR